MVQKIVVIALIFLLLQMVCVAPIAAQATPEETAKVKAAVAKLGIGPQARVEVKLRDGIKLKGYVSASDDNGFVVTDAKSGVATTVSYSQVKQVKGKNLHKGIAIAVVTGIVAAVVIGIAFLIATITGGK